ncbi:hypothetical protein H112_04185 [Trichophyton rubrum D6]|uniref:Major facilitator superfamily (MFS) profile domain-containing protein n=3 Tax=Trichophyton TaxID=5550 RepID=F2SPG7_TRIRC|nr:uncharacterized protein TERG_03965 [Trichophyton rubrum CBS 118892]EZF23031.1 hypothetical protein H100_04190 [Trichophyton rubrum MR850]EZF42072.1 hypothetical protein H102_04179 [Trichophyton rubrum CBS 100081]EZF52727.1 hypothetical protein H103_04187 [Trichophyton rubrum CBS 288.86]EZF63328.1 hypothetical protein H104_04176 [Trichophyton rubrum CBS 289.86]EZF73865.1 hypothetical protein H105_04204 [Trichophyton soudanense CBS 452.61]EZF84640.1 hypothetical protein H110_04180 [Trichophy
MGISEKQPETEMREDVERNNGPDISEKHGSEVRSTSSSEPDFSDIDEKKVIRKMDMRLIPALALLYLLSFLDRGNIGNAKIEGLDVDLGLKGGQFNWCLTVFFFTYSVFEVPSNILLKRLRPSLYLPSIMLAWGTVVTLMGIVQDYKGLLIARIFLGVAEAGLYPGVAYYITMWYCRHEVQLRQAMFFSAASIAGAFSGLLAFAIAKMDGVGGYQGWRWIFILEGLLTVVVAASAYFFLEDFPETASFLTPMEREFVIHRLKYQGSSSSGRRVVQTEEFKWKYIKEVFTDWQVYASLFVCVGIICPLYGTSLFLPSIIKDLGYKTSTAQLLTVPIYVTAATLAVVIAFYSDRSGKRSPFVIGCMCLIGIGFIICISAAGRGVPGVVYAGVFIAICGIYPAFPGAVTWLANNLAGSYKRSAGMAFQIGTGNMSGAMASNFYRALDAPKYTLGHALELGFLVAGVISAIFLREAYKRVNAKREREGTRGLSDQELSELGDKAPTFRYTL